MDPEHEIATWETYVGQPPPRRRWWHRLRQRRPAPRPKWFAVSNPGAMEFGTPPDGRVFFGLRIPQLAGAVRLVVDGVVCSVWHADASELNEEVVLSLDPRYEHTAWLEFAGGSSWVAMPQLPMLTRIGTRPSSRGVR